jgi:tetratricopeptide (TPR) repeat protein
MIVQSLRRARFGPVAILLLALLIPSHDLLGRGGGRRWGYRPPAGGPLDMMWMSANPWAALEGATIPNHSLDAPRLGPRSPSGGINYGSWARQLRTVDRSLAFPGASSNLTTRLPSSSVPPPSTPYRTGRQFDPPYFINYHSYWRNGYWGGGQWGWGRWGGPAGIASFPRWSLGSIYLVSGYGLFRNPFVSNLGHESFLDYSKPIEDIEDDDEPATNSPSADPGGTPANDSAEETAEDRLKYLVRTPEVRAGLKAFDAADIAFKNKNYELALQKTDEALEQLPDDTALHEFRALVLFARGDYQPAAATVYAVLAVSPGWDWTTLGSLYTDQEEFPRQLRDLEGYHKGHPDSAAAAFLRGYHYTTCRHFEAAVKQLQNAIRLLPDDDLLPALVALLSGAFEANPPETSVDPPSTTASPPSEEQPDQDNRPIASAGLIGEWKALRNGTTSVTLKLREDGQFVWDATQNGKPRRIAGRYAVQGNLLFLGGGSGTLVGFVEMKKHGGFLFTIPDIGPTSKGLEFAGDGRPR